MQLKVENFMGDAPAVGQYCFQPLYNASHSTFVDLAKVKLRQT
jgi:hypothetical protein